MPKVFLITGCSSGFGRELVQIILDRGDYVAATARKAEALSGFKGTTEQNFLALALDICNASQIHEAFATAVAYFGRIDVVVNNAGYGLVGPFETLSPDQIASQMSVNVFGTMEMTRKAIDMMRAQKPPGGHIVQLSSISAHRCKPNFSLYCASKWALEGFTGSVAQEMHPSWNIRFTMLEPGGFRTNWAASGLEIGNLEDMNRFYAHLNVRDTMEKMHGRQTGDPVKCASLIHTITRMKDPPLRILAGSDAVEAFHSIIEGYRLNLEQWEDLSRSTDYGE